MKSILELKNKHIDKDIYILGSGKSIEYINPSFFENKITIGVNLIHKFINTTYLTIKHYKDHTDIPEGKKLIIPEYDCGGWYGMDKNRHHTNIIKYNNYYIYKHTIQDNTKIDESILDSDTQIIVASTVTVSAMNIAYNMGAKNIILCGCDGGSVDGEWNVKGYYPNGNKNTNDLIIMRSQIEDMARILRKRNINVLSINPFVNLGLEGHIYIKKI